MDAVGRHPVEDVRVEIDEAGCHGLARDIDDPSSLRDRDIRGDPGDLAVLYRDVESAAQVLRRVDDVAALQEQVVHERVSSTVTG
jgi:hypothetical protein